MKGFGETIVICTPSPVTKEGAQCFSGVTRATSALPMTFHEPHLMALYDSDVIRHFSLSL